VESFFVSTGLVALAEIGDKTQLLALVLAARFRAPLAVTLGILFATLANHALAATLGVWIAAWLSAELLRWIVTASFVGMGLWALVPDKLDDGASPGRNAGAFLTTLIAFFFVEIGDKTQLATVALAARYETLIGVVSGTTLGMMIANIPAVLLGEWVTHKVPMHLIRYCAAGLFIVLGIAAYFALGSGGF